ncbi:hypothetical protein N431DRAFT_444047 [Stipitochalara longipes BDJ]|nr:hypothetical protein N431DRAFT_444047 [Stipitochalara longipes BDJ]
MVCVFEETVRPVENILSGGCGMSWAPRRFLVGKLERHCCGAASAHTQLPGTGRTLSVFVQPKIGVPVVRHMMGLVVQSQVIIGNAMRSDLSAQPIQKGRANQKRAEELKRAAFQEKSRTRDSPEPIPSSSVRLLLPRRRVIVHDRDTETETERQENDHRERAAARPKAPSPPPRPADEFQAKWCGWSRMIDPAGNRGWHCGDGAAPAPMLGCRFNPPALDPSTLRPFEDSPALSKGAGQDRAGQGSRLFSYQLLLSTATPLEPSAHCAPYNPSPSPAPPAPAPPAPPIALVETHDLFSRALFVARLCSSTPRARVGTLIS